MQSYHDRHPEVGLAAQWLPWGRPIARWASHWHSNLREHEAPEQQASHTSCLSMHGLKTTQLLRAGAMSLLQYVFRHGKASGSSGRRRRVLRHAVYLVLSTSANQPKLSPLHPPAQQIIICEPATCLMHCTWSCQFQTQRPGCSHCAACPPPHHHQQFRAGAHPRLCTPPAGAHAQARPLQGGGPRAAGAGVPAVS